MYRRSGEDDEAREAQGGRAGTLVEGDKTARRESVSSECQEIPQFPTERSPQYVDALKRLRLPQNTLYVSKKSAMIAHVDYKTSNLYGPQRFEFSEKVSKLTLEYINLNKLLETDKTSGTIFGKSGMPPSSATYTTH